MLIAPPQTEARKKKKKKVTLCHEGQTISVSKKAKKAHLAHGDTLGKCASCVPRCGGRVCGDDGCGGSCGDPCPSDRVCRDGLCACLAGLKYCRGECIPEAACCENTDCTDTKACIGGACQCPSTTYLCNEICIPNTSCCTDTQCSGGTPRCCKSIGNQQYANGFCIEASSCCGNSDCASGQTCNQFTGQCEA